MLSRASMFCVTAAGAGAGAVTAIAAVPGVLAQAAGGTTELGPVITGGGALSLTAVLGFIAIKLARGELVPRDVKAVEAALTKLATDGQKREEALEQVAGSNGELLRETLEQLAETRATLGPYHRPPGGQT